MNASINQLITATAQQLAQKYNDKTLCTQYAWWMVEAITGKKKAALIAQSDVTLTHEQHQKLQQWIKQQVTDHVPLAYLIGSIPFLSTEIIVHPPILIPRQETEEWCARLIEQLNLIPHPHLRILDLCTGSGCLAIALAKELPKAKIYASDISEKALALAQKNSEHNDIQSITFFTSDLFNDIPESVTFDLIISNPPYISYDEWQDLDPSVKEWEDKHALYASENGIGIIRQLIAQAAARLRPHKILHKLQIPQLIIEIGHKQGATVKALFEKEGFTNVRVHTDLYGKDRIVSGCVNEKAA